ncbi:unnamed protein product [Nesidiocoris tenuis]|nr:unnamed protein product [Nesidiocoris tenuis]
MVIRARGRKSVPITWSPLNMNYTPPSSRFSPNKEHTPNKNQSSIITRSTPRKRLLLLDSPDRNASSSPDRREQPSAKRLRIESPAPAFDGPIHLAMKALSPEQLISVVRNIVSRHPSLEEEIRKCLPAPDLRPIKDRLHELKRNIFKSLPTSRMCSKTDASAYTRAATHLNVFKKAVIEEGKLLSSSQQWDCVLEYVVFAWEQVAATPTWDNHLHNALKRQCFKFLGAQCFAALEKNPSVLSNAEQLAYYTAK